MSKLDQLLASRPTPDPQTLRRTRASLSAELRVARAGAWQADVLKLTASLWALAAAVALVMIVAQLTSGAQVMAHAMPIAPLMLVGAVGSWAALAPRRSSRLLIAVAAAALGMVAMVVSRGAGAEGSAPEWVCTVSHVTVALGPLTVALLTLRRAAHHPLRALAAGLAVGTTGAVVGELACARSWEHVLGYHVTAWAVVAAMTLVLSYVIKPRSFAP